MFWFTIPTELFIGQSIFFIFQGCHSTWKTWKTWKTHQSQGKPGKLREFPYFFENSGKTQGKNYVSVSKYTVLLFVLIFLIYIQGAQESRKPGKPGEPGIILG